MADAKHQAQNFVQTRPRMGDPDVDLEEAKVSNRESVADEPDVVRRPAAAILSLGNDEDDSHQPLIQRAPTGSTQKPGGTISVIQEGSGGGRISTQQVTTDGQAPKMSSGLEIRQPGGQRAQDSANEAGSSDEEPVMIDTSAKAQIDAHNMQFEPKEADASMRDTKSKWMNLTQSKFGDARPTSAQREAQLREQSRELSISQGIESDNEIAQQIRETNKQYGTNYMGDLRRKTLRFAKVLDETDERPDNITQ